jgi:imidazolonepropionase-like amidohydrolase
MLQPANAETPATKERLEKPANGPLTTTQAAIMAKACYDSIRFSVKAVRPNAAVSNKNGRIVVLHRERAASPGRRAALAVAAATLVSGAAAALFAGAAGAQSAPAHEVKYVQAGRLLADPSTGRVETNKTVVVTDGKITEIRDGFVSGPGGEVVNLRDSFVLPGLIDTHVHILSQQGPTRDLDAVKKSESDLALDGARYALITLKAGFTTVADVGDDNEPIFALRDAIAKGAVPGPRIVTAGYILTPHGGHADVHSFRPDVMEVLENPRACSGADECRRMVRKQVQAGADLIKITATGGVLDDAATGVDQQFTDEEMAAIVQTAHALGRRVKAHAHGTVGINAALRAGVDSIEHGTYLDGESIKLFKEHDAFLVPTLLAGATVAEEAAKPDTWMPPAVKAKALQVGPNMIAMARRAHEGGVKIAFGTDSGVSHHGINAREFSLLVKAGLSPMEAITAGTVTASQNIGLSATVGTIAPGKSADIVAVKGDPLKDVSELERVSFVMKTGTVYKQ